MSTLIVPLVLTSISQNPLCNPQPVAFSKLQYQSRASRPVETFTSHVTANQYYLKLAPFGCLVSLPDGVYTPKYFYSLRPVILLSQFLNPAHIEVSVGGCFQAKFFCISLFCSSFPMLPL